MTIRIIGIEFENADEAIQHINASGHGVAISIGGKVLVVEQAEADRLAARRIEFAYLVDHEMRDGSWRIMTIPVND
jgi:hypothetical protein